MSGVGMKVTRAARGYRIKLTDGQYKALVYLTRLGAGAIEAGSAPLPDDQATRQGINKLSRPDALVAGVIDNRKETA